MNPFVTHETYTRTVKLGESEWQVTLRPLSAGDRAAIQDLTRVSSGGEDVGLQLGTMQMLTVTRAVVTWTLPQPPTAETIAALHPDLFEQIFELTSFGEIPAEEGAAAADPLAESSSGSSEPSAVESS
jgi:hypothetical protein